MSLIARVTTDPNSLSRKTLSSFLNESTELANLVLCELPSILERTHSAFVILDENWRIVYANPAACKLSQKPQAELLGVHYWDEWAQSRGTERESQYRRAMAEMTDAHLVHQYIGEGRHLWLEIDVFSSEYGLNVFYRDITQEKNAEIALVNSRQNLQLAVDAAQIGTFYCDFPLDKIIWNTTCKEHFFLPPDAEIDFDLFYSLLHPDDLEPTRQAIAKALNERTTYNVDYRAVSADGRTRWINAVGRFYYDIDGEPIRFDGVTHDISDRKNARLALDNANQRIIRLLESITDAFYTLDREWRFTFVNTEAECVLRKSREELLGNRLWDVFPLAASTRFASEFHRALSEGVAVYIEEYSPSLKAWLEVRAYPSAEGLSVFFQNVDARKAIEAEREQLLAESIAKTKREMFLKRIAHAMHSSDPDQVQQDVVELLGTELNADRCYFAIYDLKSGRVVIAKDYHTSALNSIQGVHSFTNTLEMFRELYRDSNVSTIPDAEVSSLSEQTKENMRRLLLRSRISVSLADAGGVMMTLTAAMSAEARVWTPAEAELVAAVADQLRSGLSAARTVQREHNIALTLQGALQPDLPTVTPGLALAKYYRPALEQSEGVGGDFFDVFAVGCSTTVLVVGDLSGKGLAAAAQVSTVRNMLRAFLYSLPSVVDAVTELNRILVQNELINGFATLFVGLYDHSNSKLTYVSCGQEPGLILRQSTGDIAFLDETGTVIGAVESAEYTFGETTLYKGDALAIFTDGLTEIGPSRKEMIGVEGVAKLFRSANPAAQDLTDAQFALKIADTIAAGVESSAQHGVRDDMCLLVAVVSGAK